MSHSAVLTPPDVEAFNHILNLAKPGKPYPLDFSDEVQYHFYLNGVLASGMTPERYPQFFKTLDMSRRRHLDKTIAPLAAKKQGDGSPASFLFLLILLKLKHHIGRNPQNPGRLPLGYSL
jgi:hypothetical protein